MKIPNLEYWNLGSILQSLIAINLANLVVEILPPSSNMDVFYNTLVVLLQSLVKFH